jgi:hypothetical protein
MVAKASTAGVNFTNIFQAAFSYESFLCSFYVLTIWVCNFLAKGFWQKTAHKMLVKLTPGINFNMWFCQQTLPVETKHKL